LDCSFEGVIKTKYEEVGGTINKLWSLFLPVPLPVYRQYQHPMEEVWNMFIKCFGKMML
jgi:hypothetical protein